MERLRQCVSLLSSSERITVSAQFLRLCKAAALVHKPHLSLPNMALLPIDIPLDRLRLQFEDCSEGEGEGAAAAPAPEPAHVAQERASEAYARGETGNSIEGGWAEDGSDDDDLDWDDQGAAFMNRTAKGTLLFTAFIETVKAVVLECFWFRVHCINQHKQIQLRHCLGLLSRSAFVSDVEAQQPLQSAA